MTSTYKITLDLHEMVSPIAVNVKKGETGRALEITLAEDGKPVEIPSGTVAIIGVGSGTSGYYGSCSITGNTISYTMTSDVTGTVGAHIAELKIYSLDDSDEIDELLYSASFIINVFPVSDISGYAEEGDNDYTALETLLAQAGDFLDNDLLISSVEFDSATNTLTICEQPRAPPNYRWIGIQDAKKLFASRVFPAEAKSQKPTGRGGMLSFESIPVTAMYIDSSGGRVTVNLSASASANASERSPSPKRMSRASSNGPRVYAILSPIT